MSLDRSDRLGGNRARLQLLLVLAGGVLFVGAIAVLFVAPSILGGAPVAGPGGGDGPGEENGSTASATSDPAATTTTTTPASEGDSPDPTRSTASPASEASATPTPGRQTATSGARQRVLYRVNVGGPRLSAPGQDWTADLGSSGSRYTNAWESGSAASQTDDRISTTDAVPDATPREVFQTRRFDRDEPDDPRDDREMRWTFPVDGDQTYRVRLYFAETWLRADEYPSNEKYGPRVFDVTVEGRTVLSDYNMFARLGHDRGTVRTFTVRPDDGTIDVRFLHDRENPMLSGISVVSANKTANASQPTGSPE